MMKQKKMLNFYTPMDGDALARTLEKQAQKGWHLTKYGDFFLHFTQGEPTDTHYAVTYFPESTYYDPYMPEGQETYVDMCAQYGWELADFKGPMQIFRSDRADPIPIETDEGYKLESIHKSMKKTVLLSRILVMLSMAINLMNQNQSFRYSPLSYVSSNTSLILFASILSLTGYLVFEVVWYILWYLCSKRAVADGKPCVDPKTGLRKYLLHIPLAAALLMVVVLVADAPSRRARLLYSLIFFCTFLLCLSMVMVPRYLKKKGYPAQKHRNVLFLFAIAASLAFCAAVIACIMTFDLQPTLEEQVEAMLAQPEPPLTLQDLDGGRQDAANWSTLNYDRSFLARYTQYIEHDSESSLEYQVAEIEWDWLRELCFDRLAKSYHYTPCDADWQAERLMQLEHYDSTRPYLALYGDRILYVEYDVLATPEEMQLIFDRLLAYAS